MPFIDPRQIKELNEKLSRQNLPTAVEEKYYSIGDFIAQKEEILKIIGDFSNKIEKERHALEYELPMIAYREVWPARYEDARAILVANTTDALSRTQEFLLPGWADSLLRICQNPRLIQVFPTTKSISQGSRHIQLNVQIDMNRYAGRIQDYSAVVSSVRSQLGYGNTLQGEQSSFIWYIKLYMSARKGNIYYRLNRKTGEKKYYPDLTEKYTQMYNDIMASRLNDMADKAPFWYLLEHGNANVPMASNKGGSPKPLYPPTRFVAKSILGIKNLLETEINSRIDILRTMAVEAISRFEDNIRDLQDINLLYDRLIIEATNDEAKWDRERQRREVKLHKKLVPVNTNVQNLRRKILQKIEEVTGELDVESPIYQLISVKMEVLVAELMFGDIPANKRLYLLTYRGKEYRVRLVALIKQIEKELGYKIEDSSFYMGDAQSARDRLKDLRRRIK